MSKKLAGAVAGFWGHATYLGNILARGAKGTFSGTFRVRFAGAIAPPKGTFSGHLRCGWGCVSQPLIPHRLRLAVARLSDSEITPPATPA